MSEPAFDELLRRLAEANVEFVVVGGLAVNAWGVVRGTKDVDIVVAPDILGVTVAVCSIGDLKAMKRAAGRTRDLADLEDLDAASS